MAFRSSSSALGPSNGSVVITKPSGVIQGDMLITAVMTAANTVTFPSGFTAGSPAFTTSGAHSRGETWNWAWKYAGASEPATYTISISGYSSPVCGVMGAWSGRASSPGTATGTNESGFGTTTFTSTLTGYTASQGDDLCILVGVAALNTAGTWATTTSGSSTVSIDQNGSFGSFTSGETGIAYQNNLAAGATGNYVFTETLSSGTGSQVGEGTGVLIPLPVILSASIAWVT